jgi:hypothetical protein
VFEAGAGKEFFVRENSEEDVNECHFILYLLTICLQTDLDLGGMVGTA